MIEVELVGGFHDGMRRKTRPGMPVMMSVARKGAAGEIPDVEVVVYLDSGRVTPDGVPIYVLTHLAPE